MSARPVPPDERTLVWRSFDAFNRRDPDALLAFYTEGCVWSLDHFGGWPDDQEYRGHDGLRRLADDFLGAWGEFRITATGLWHLGGPRWLIRARMTATGRSSGVPLDMEFWQVGTVVGRRIDTVAQYTERDEALAAAGVTLDDL